MDDRARLVVDEFEPFRLNDRLASWEEGGKIENFPPIRRMLPKKFPDADTKLLFIGDKVNRVGGLSLGNEDADLQGIRMWIFHEVSRGLGDS